LVVQICLMENEMKKIIVSVFFVVCGFGSVSLQAQSADQEYNEYCQSLAEGLAEEDARQAVNECLQEQAAIAQQEDVEYVQDPVEQACYEKAEAVLEQNPDADYDEIVRVCLEQNM
ncbi:MAG: hypothetical protein CUN55_19540, partial [Phototrophicales bacterium]